MPEIDKKNDKSIRKGLSKAEAALLAELAEEGKKIFTAKELIGKTGSKTKAYLAASRLTKKRWLTRITKGTYMLAPLEAGKTPAWSEHEYAIAAKLARPYYIGFLNALNFHNLTEQIPAGVTIATTKPRKTKAINNVKYYFVALNKHKFFGLATIKIAGTPVLVSDKEKTLVDCLDHPEHCGTIFETAKALYNAKDNVSWETLVKYAKKNGNKAVFKRLGYLAELLKLNLPEPIIKEATKNLSTGYAPLSPESKTKGRHNTKWRVIVNYPTEKLLTVME